MVEIEKKLVKLCIEEAAGEADFYAEVILRLIVAANDDEFRMTLSEYAYTDTDMVLVEVKLAIDSLDAIVLTQNKVFVTVRTNRELMNSGICQFV